MIKARRQRTERNGGQADCPNGVHCEQFEQVAENNLLQRLRDGWQIVHRFANGEVIVRR